MNWTGHRRLTALFCLLIPATSLSQALLGMEVQYIEVPGGTHSGVVAPNAAAMFDFFDAHRRGAKSQP
jgi:hypothetical protein